MSTEAREWLAVFAAGIGGVEMGHIESTVGSVAVAVVTAAVAATLLEFRRVRCQPSERAQGVLND